MFKLTVVYVGGKVEAREFQKLSAIKHYLRRHKLRYGTVNIKKPVRKDYVSWNVNKLVDGTWRLFDVYRNMVIS